MRIQAASARSTRGNRFNKAVLLGVSVTFMQAYKCACRDQQRFMRGADKLQSRLLWWWWWPVKERAVGQPGHQIGTAELSLDLSFLAIRLSLCVSLRRDEGREGHVA